jgi:hypothetical protein
LFGSSEHEFALTKVSALMELKSGWKMNYQDSAPAALKMMLDNSLTRAQAHRRNP